MMEKLKLREALLAVAAAVLAFVGAQFGLVCEIPEQAQVQVESE